MLYSKQEGHALLKKKLKIAGIDKTPKQFLAQALRGALLVGFVIAGVAFVFIQRSELPQILPFVAGLVVFLMTYTTLMKSVDVKINRKAKKIDRDVLFAGRFLLIKINSGKPLINSFVEASQSKGVANSYFKKIVRNIELGTPLEKALEAESDECPSKRMKRILFQINNALKIGIDVTQNLESVLEEIANDQLIEIQRYGKKLNSLTLFYMLAAVVAPSLGMTMFIIVAGLVSLDVGPSSFFVFIFFLILLELGFLSLFKSIRPNVNI